jgi:hypothetical protein
MPMLCECLICHCSFPVKPYLLRLGRGKYCSPACYGQGKRRFEWQSCPVCFTCFRPKRRQQYCSKICEHSLAATRLRFQRTIEYCAHPKPCPFCCALWTGARQQTGHARIRIHPKIYLGHRLAWEWWHARNIPPNGIIVHYCGVLHCVNPEHLYLTTRQEYGAKALVPRGEESFGHLLTTNEVLAIRQRYAAGESAAALARAYGRPYATIRGIVLRYNWRHLPKESLVPLPVTSMSLRIGHPRLTRAQWDAIKAAYDYRCIYCGQRGIPLTKDHLTAFIVGGEETVHNIVPACSPCNTRKKHGPVLRPVQPLLLIAI